MQYHWKNYIPLPKRRRNCPWCLERDGNRLRRKSRGTNQRRDDSLLQSSCQTETPATSSRGVPRRGVPHLSTMRWETHIPTRTRTTRTRKGDKPRMKRRDRNTTLSGRLGRAHGTIQTNPYREIFQQAT